MIPLQSYHILFMIFFRLCDGEFIPTKIISFTFFSTFLSKTTFKDKTYFMTSVQGLCQNPKQLKNERKLELATVFRGRKDSSANC